MNVSIAKSNPSAVSGNNSQMWITALVAVGILSTACLARNYAKARSLRNASWDQLVAQIQPMHEEGLRLVAGEHLQPQGKQVGIDPDLLWGMIGGDEGLRRMRHNADLFINLAAYVQHWHFTEAVVVAERIRQGSILLKRALFRIRIHTMLTSSAPRLPFYVHQAAASYYLMTQRLLALYET